MMQIPSALSHEVRRVGSCVRCMRQSFWAAFVISTVGIPTAALGMLANVSWLTAAAVTATAAAIALWLLHLAVFSMRAVAFVQANPPSGELPRLDRRRAAAVFTGAFLFGIGLTATRKAEAQTCPPGWGCEDFYCDDPRFPQLLCNYLRCETMCIPERATPCMSRYQTWYCPENSSCLGDGSAQMPAGCS